MYALSVRQPWAFGIVCLGKEVENRSRATNIRGRVLIHASAYKPKDMELIAFKRFAEDILKRRPLPAELAEFAKSVSLPYLPRGGFVGTVEIVDCVRKHRSPWRSDTEFAYVLSNPKRIAFRPAKGQRGFWDVAGAEAWT